MSLLDFIQAYGGLLGLGIYILLVHIIPFLKEKWWPQIVKEKEEVTLMRRKQDARLMDLKEREVVAQEQIGKSLIILSERIAKLEQETRAHDDRSLHLISQLTSTLSAMQSGLNVLKDRSTRRKTG